MVEIVNLRLARKQRARRLAADAAASNRARFGRTVAEKSRDATQAEKAVLHLNHHQLDKDKER